MKEKEAVSPKEKLNLNETLTRAIGRDVDPQIIDAIGTILMGLHFSFPAETIMRGSGARNVIEGESPTSSLIYSEANRVLREIPDEFYENNPAWITTRDRLNEPSDIDFRFTGIKSSEEFDETLINGIHEITESDEFLELKFDIRTLQISYDDIFIDRQKNIYKLAITNNTDEQIILDLGYQEISKGDTTYDRRSGKHSTLRDYKNIGALRKQFKTDFTFPFVDKTETNGVLSYGGIGHYTNALRVMAHRGLRGDSVDFTNVSRAMTMQEKSPRYQSEQQQYLLMLAVSDPDLFLDTLCTGFYSSGWLYPTLEIMKRFNIFSNRPEKLYADFDLGIPPNIVALSKGRAKDFDTRFDFPQYDTSIVINNLSNENIKPVDRLIRVLKKRKIINEDGGYEDLLRLLTPIYPQYPT